MLRAIAAAKRKNDRIDAGKICDCLRCDFLPECYMASTAIREQRRTLRYRKQKHARRDAELILKLVENRNATLITASPILPISSLQ